MNHLILQKRNEMKKQSILLLFLCFSIIGNTQIMLDSTILNERVVVSDLEIPWDMTYGPDGWIWFTEVAGNIHRFHPDTEEHQLIFTIDDVHLFGFAAGLHAIILHPDFNDNHYLFVHYLNSETSSKIVRYTFDEANGTLVEPMDILTDIIGAVSHNGSRMLILDDKLLISIGDGYNNPDLAQSFDTNSGKFLRLNLDGTIPDDNPIPDSYIWSWGHRNQQGLCIGNGILYSSEHGTAIADEINIIEQNRNYGWPEVEGFCDTSEEMDFCDAQNVVEPIWEWTPSIAPCGIDFFDHASVPEWQNSLLVSTLKDRRLIQLKLSDDGLSIVEENHFLMGTYGRLRDVLVLPDGRIYICTTNHDFFGNPFPNDDRIIELKSSNITAARKLKNDNILKVYPNPASASIAIDWPENNSQKMLLEVFDINGLLLYKKTVLFQKNVQLATDNFPNGVLIFKMTNTQTQFVQKIVIEH